jgi:hypothetical protein
MSRVAHPAIPIVAAITWFIALSHIDADEVGDLGLVSAMPATAFVVLAALTVSFVGALAQREFSERLVLLHVVALIAMLYGATAAVADVPSFSVTWRHAGVAEHISLYGSIDRSVDAYFNWPGFFALAAVASDLAGLDNPVDLARWVPLVLNLLYLPPVVIIARSVTVDPRAVWAGVWVFFATNWVGQDYFSPQGLTYVLYLVLLAVLLTWFTGPSTGRRWIPQRLQRTPAVRMGAAPLGEEPLRYGQRAALFALCAIVVVATAVTHQLTPFAMLVTVAAMVLVGRCSLGGLPLFILVAVVGWLTFAAGPFLEGHIDALKDDVGQLGTTLSANVGDRVQGSDEHTTVVWFRIGLTVLVWGLGIAGAIAIFAQDSCAKRGYDLRATPDRCPECGAFAPRRHAAAPPPVPPPSPRR